MKRVGFLLIVFGFLAASWVAVQHHLELNWTLFAPAFMVGLIGVVVVRRTSRQEAIHADTVAANIEEMDQSLARIVENVTLLNREKEMIHTYDMRHKIDELLVDDINRFVDARETMAVKYGLHYYAEVMSHFAAGERYLNRVWSCSADGYIDEVNAYIARAEEQFNDTLAVFHKMRGTAD